jgi:IclR family acetate operon transcriptional repressor
MTAERKPVDKTLRALNWLVETSAKDVGVRQLATAMNVAPSSAHRILLTLAKAGFVQQDPVTQRYSLGNELFRVSQLALIKAPLWRAGLPAIQRLVDTCRESAVLCVFDEVRREVIYSTAIDAPNSDCNAMALNKWLPVRTGASGLAILAFLDEDDLHSVLRQSRYLQCAHDDSAERDRLCTKLAAVRSCGYAIADCQWVAGAIGLAAPVFGRSGRVMGDICVTIPRARSGGGNMERLADAALSCARDISRRILDGADATAARLQ